MDLNYVQIQVKIEKDGFICLDTSQNRRIWILFVLYVCAYVCTYADVYICVRTHVYPDITSIITHDMILQSSQPQPQPQ